MPHYFTCYVMCIKLFHICFEHFYSNIITLSVMYLSKHCTHHSAGTLVSHLPSGVPCPAACLFNKHMFTPAPLRCSCHAPMPNLCCFNADNITPTRSIHGINHASLTRSLFIVQVNGVAMLSYASKVCSDLY